MDILHFSGTVVPQLSIFKVKVETFLNQTSEQIKLLTIFAQLLLAVLNLVYMLVKLGILRMPHIM